MFSQNKFKDSCYNQEEPLNYYAFKKMMRENYNFAIVGTQTPTSGFKFETNKPTITLKGNIISGFDKRMLVNLELTGGLQNDLMKVFAGDELNGFFKASLGFNFMLEGGNDAIYDFDNDFTKELVKRQVCEYREEVSRQIDTMVVLQVLEDYAQPQSPVPTLDAFAKYASGLALKDEYNINGYYRNKPDAYYSELIMDLIHKRYMQGNVNDSTATKEEQWTRFIKSVKSTDSLYIKTPLLLADVKKAAKFKYSRNHKYDLWNAYAIETIKDIWVRKTLTWLNVSLAAGNSSFHLYDNITNTVINSNSFLPALSVTYNFYTKWAAPGKFLFIRVGATAKKENNLAELKKFDYKKETVISTGIDEELKSEKTGTAYAGLLKEGGGVEFPLEIYYTPWNFQAIPGLYTKIQYCYSNAWFNRNKLSADLGLTWNVTNSDKDGKNLLTIVPFVSWSNFLNEYSDQIKENKKKLSDLFSVNVKFGVPINLGK